MKPFRSLSRRAMILVTALLSVAAIALGASIYVSFFQKDGLDKLPAKPCRGAISRETIKKTLQDTESVNLRNFQTKSGFTFWEATCNIFTHEKSGIHVEARVRDTTFDGWIEDEKRMAGDDGKAIQFEAGRGAISWPHRSIMYVQCNPKLADRKPVGEFALMIETHVRGSMRIDGQELRQRLANITIQMASYARKAVDCQERSFLPTPSDHVLPA
ncbi:hypothetical protein [Streptomyces sp. NPDC097640]|uniref:hypothetical protein n=1 Tax=Streptomyces sp. NPDC097640 TaxID=3157229 RepID=UPI003332B18F